MDRIVEINEEHMYAVVEPYVISAQLQAELMKRGFNCNICGAGSNCSAHPFAAHAGIGHMGETAGLRERNILGVEWVTPEGEIVKLGALGSSGEWFCGDGPGPSLRGILLGHVQPLGGMGVFTRAATKIYHWAGPSTFPIDGISPRYAPAEIPPNFFYRYYTFPTMEEMFEAQRRIGESEIAFEVMGFNLAMLASNIGTDNDEDLGYFAQFRQQAQGPGFQVILIGNSVGDLEYKKKVLAQIIAETKGESLKPMEDPKLAAGVLWRSIRITASVRECYRAGGTFTAVLGGTRTFAEEVRYMEECSKRKKELIAMGLIRDDGGDYLTWSHELGHLGHAEMLLQFKATPEVEAALGTLGSMAQRIAIETHYGVPHNKSAHDNEVMGPHACNFHLWMKKLKAALDPKETADPSGYISGR
jgi:glycolate oxidase